MSMVEVNHIVKSYADKVAVSDVSFEVNRGEIFGLIGPNGAGKSTTIRIMMNIFKPDSGSVSMLGKPLSEASKNDVGYLPEERGLYKKLSVIESIVYLASLKGMDKKSAIKRTDELLEQTGMLPVRGKKIEELSKGMSQIIQFIVTIVHDPGLVILDEPFAGLDPANAELLKNMVIDLKNKGKAVVMSTHRMDEVEALCDRLLMINKGRAVLYGALAEIKSGFRQNSVLLEHEGDLGDIHGIAGVNKHNGYTELVPDGKTSPQQLLERLVNRGIKISRFEIATPSLHEIFLKVAGERHE